MMMTSVANELNGSDLDSAINTNYIQTNGQKKNECFAPNVYDDDDDLAIDV